MTETATAVHGPQMTVERISVPCVRFSLPNGLNGVMTVTDAHEFAMALMAASGPVNVPDSPSAPPPSEDAPDVGTTTTTTEPAATEDTETAKDVDTDEPAAVAVDEGQDPGEDVEAKPEPEPQTPTY